MNLFINCLQVLTGIQKRDFYLICITSVVLTFLELIGISLFFSIISILVDFNKFSEVVSGYKFFNFIKNYNKETILVNLLFFLVIFFFLKGIINIFGNYVRSKLFFNLIASISYTLFNGYLSQNIRHLVKENSAYISRNIIEYPTYFVQNVLQGFYSILFEASLILGIIIIFLNIDLLIGSAIFIALIAFMFFFFLFNKKKLDTFGKSLNDRYAERLKVAREAIEGIKEIQIYNKQDFFKKVFLTHNYRIAGITTILNVKENLPRNILEFLIVLFIVLVILYLLTFQKNTQELIPVLSFISLGLARAIPSINKILSSLQRIKSNTSVVDKIIYELKKFKNIEKNKNIIFSFDKKIELKKIFFNYSDKKLILNNINFNINKNKIFGLKGRSGSGKTTCLNIILGFLNSKSGEVLVDGVNINENINNWQQLISYVPQRVFITDGSIKNNIAFGIPDEKINLDNLNYAIKYSQLEEFLILSKNKLNTKVGESGQKLSSGQIQRIGLARALYKKPDLLILDEPTSSLDFLTEKIVLDDIAKIKKITTIIIVSHSARVFSICDSYYDLDKNKIFYK
jgi:ABC-type multidrug transport system fused ATPase/permease subunit